MSETTYYERNRVVMLNSGKYYYENNKELLRERAETKFSEEEKKYKERIWKKKIS